MKGGRKLGKSDGNIVERGTRGHMIPFERTGLRLDHLRLYDISSGNGSKFRLKIVGSR